MDFNGASGNATLRNSGTLSANNLAVTFTGTVKPWMVITSLGVPSVEPSALVGHSIGELVALKKLFGVSIQALAYRCKDLGIINQAACARLFKVFAERGWRTAPFEEPESMQPELEEPRRFERLCYRALAEGVIGESRAAELLGISVRELDRRLDQVAA